MVETDWQLNSSFPLVYGMEFTEGDSYSFDGVNKVISLVAGVTTLDVRDLYSRWKQWIEDNGSGYLQAFSVVGGEPIDSSQGIYVTSYFFLENGWKIRPYAGNHTLTVSNGVLIDASGGTPFLQTVGSYNVLVLYSQPIKSETVDIGGGSAPSASTVAAAVWDLELSGHTAEGTAGEALDDAGLAGNPWSATISGNTGAGTFGEAVNRINKVIGWLRGLL